jgi:DNA/RNA-binding domain of Phe-tRNA-synthetase-like protein
VLARQVGASDEKDLSQAERLALSTADAAPLVSAGLPEDALVVAAVETGVPLLAFDAAALNGGLALRRARGGERIGGHELEEGTVLIADRERPLAVLLGPRASDVAVTGATERIVLAAIQAKGVPTLAVEEAMWTAIEIMREGA